MTRVIGSARPSVRGVAVSEEGIPVRRATVTVTDVATSLPAVIYSDAALTTPIANPMTADANGVYEFWVADGTYSLAYAGLARMQSPEQVQVASGLAAPPGTLVRGSMKVTSGATRPTSPAVGDIHVMAGPDYNVVTQLPWAAAFLGDTIAQSDGTKVAQWNDQTANARHAANATTSTQPNFRARVAKMGDRAVVEGDAAAGACLRTAEWTTGTAQPNTICAVGRIADVSQCGWDTANTSFVQRLSRASSGDWNMKGSTATTLAATPGDSRPHAFVCVYNGVTSSLRIDGVTVATGDAGANSLRGLTLLARNDLGVPNGGYLGFLGVVDDLLTADQLSAWEWWARNYYRLAWAAS